MGIRYSAVVDVVGGAPGAVYAEFLATATRGAVVHVVRLETKDALGAQVGLSRAFAIGSGTSYATGIAHRVAVPTMPIGTGSARLNTVWTGAAPTGYVSRLRDEVIAGATGTLRHLWSSDVDGPLVVEPLGSLLITNQGSGIAANAMKIAITWEEGDVSAR